MDIFPSIAVGRQGTPHRLRAAWSVHALLAAVLFLAVGAAAAADLTDDAGRRVTLRQPPTRVVTLAPSLTEFVYALGAGDRLVATVRGSDHPTAAARLPRVGDHQRLDIERLLALRPDLVLVWLGGSSQRELAQIEAAGIALYHVEPRRLDDLPTTFERLGALLGHADAGRRAAAQQRDSLAALRREHAQAPPVRVFYQVWEQPLMTLGGPQLLTDMLAACGGVNVYAGVPLRAPTVSVESVVAADPEAIMTAGSVPVTPGSRTAGSAPAHPLVARTPHTPALRRWQSFPRMTAVAREWLYTVSADEVSRAGPRTVAGAGAICAVLAQVRAERGGVSLR